MCRRPGPDPLHVTLTPKKLKTGIGSTVILSCALMGSPEFTIRWYRNTELVLPDEAISIRGLSNETLLITSAQKSHSGAYQCFATRRAQTAQDFAIIVLEGERGQPGQSGGAGLPEPGQEERDPRPPPSPPDRRHLSSTSYTLGRCLFYLILQGPCVKILFFLMLPVLQLRKLRLRSLAQGQVTGSSEQGCGK